jgi:5-methylcytosine-specific restriction endonuclease McrA
MATDLEVAVSNLRQSVNTVKESLEGVEPGEIDQDNWEEELGDFLDAIEDLEDIEPKVYEEIYDERSGKGRIRKYLRDNVGSTVSSERIARVSGIKQYARRIRELRNEEGFIIDSTRTRSELKQNEYYVREIKEDFDEKSRISVKARKKQIDRQASCEICGRHRDSPDVKYIEVDHIESFIDFDDPDAVNDPENLRTLCNDCHHGKSAADNIANRR